ncbi:MAG: hypothetical protein HON40_06335, partial [Flavobacteriales bacterium]|nr:hypothetical protein [Flavobacteriales bacterium]
APTMSQIKYGLVAGESYRAGARAYCDPNISAHRSWWTPFIFWTQPGSVIRLAKPELTERKLLKITDLLGREVDPVKVIDKTTLFYIYDDGSVEMRVTIK